MFCYFDHFESAELVIFLRMFYFTWSHSKTTENFYFKEFFTEKLIITL